MREFLTSGQVGNIELNEQKRIRKQITDRWDGLGLTEGLKGVVKENVSMLYENEAKHLLREAVAADNSGSFETVVFPIIRRIFSKLLANDIVSVQAMNLPVGRLFFILPKTSQRVEGVDESGNTVLSHNGLMGYDRTDRRTGEKVKRFYLPDVVIGNKNTDPEDVPVTKYMKKSLYDLFYNDFLYDNSKGKIHIKAALAEKMMWEDGELVTLSGTPKVYQDGTVRNLIIRVSDFANYNAGRLTGPDGCEMDSEAFLASLKVVCSGNIEGDTSFAEFEEAIPFRVVTQKYGHGIVDYDREDFCSPQGEIFLDLDLTKPCKKQGASMDGYLGVDPEALEGVDFVVTWNQYDSLELETEMGEVGFELTSVTVTVEERKLRATWSPELAQDVSAFHNIDAEAELTALLSEEVAAELDREILRDLRKVAPWQARWDVNGWRRMASFSTNYTQKDWNQELVTKINQVSAQIHKSTLRGGANFIVVSSEISAVFDNLEYFHVSDASAEQDQYNMGIERTGALQNRYQVYRDPYSPHWSIIIGHKGKSLLDTGYVYAPYIPMQLTPTIINPENFAPVKGIMTRYAKKCVNNKFYGAVRVDGLVTWNPDELR